MSMTIIDNLYNRSLEIIKFLENQNEVTYKSDYEEWFKKILILSVASYFESLVREIILKFTENQAKNIYIYNFIRNKGIERQYHTYFDWDSKNANRFFSLFGDDFKKKCEKIIKSDLELENSIKAFLELGQTRNQLVHLNFAAYSLSKTSDEYYTEYREAMKFLSFFEGELNR